MVDVVDTRTRSRMMSGIKGSNTRPETELRKALHRLGLRFRLHDRNLPGRPDIVLRRWEAVILVHGCFWHQHEGCRYATMPATRTEFWRSKFEANKTRDERSLTELKARGWRTAVVWECSLRRGGANEVALHLAEWLGTGSSSLEIPVFPTDFIQPSLG